MNDINYEVKQNRHTLAGAAAALKVLLSFMAETRSLLDVDCGPGSWLRAAIDLGITDVQGIEGRIPDNELLFCDEKHIQNVNLTSGWSLHRKFDVALCLEVAEHLPGTSAPSLIHKLCLHADNVIFSAALPEQLGQHHINCQWPIYWQELFNQEGFVCFDDLRWKIWDHETIEPWYRQNVFRTVKNAALAGSEPRIPSVIHPAMHEGMLWQAEKGVREKHRLQIEQGSEPVNWYPVTLCRALLKKVMRRFRPNHGS